MKKIILSMILVFSITGVFAQKGNVSKAKNKTLQEEPDFAGARELIKPALEDPTTKDLASTWFVAGTIGYKENDALYQKMALQQPADPIVKGKAIIESYNYYLTAYKLDSLPDKKGKIKPKYQKEIKDRIKEYYTIQQNLVAYGAKLFEKKEYAEAVNVFELYLGIPKLPMMNNEITLDSTFYMIKYYTAIGYTYSNQTDKAIAMLESMKNDNYEELTVHQLLYQEYQSKKDTANFVKILKEGFEKFPTEAWFLQNLINYYIYSDQKQEALVYLTSAIEREPKMAQYRYVKGNLDESLGNLEDARASFDKAIELDPTISDAYAGIGRLYYNKAVKMADAANDIKDNKLYNAAKKKADAVFAESIPYFKKAVELKPDDTENKRTLRTLYYRLRMNKEFDAIDKELGQ